MIIDTHTHIGSEKIYQSYFKKAKGRISKALVLYFYKTSFKELSDFIETKDNLYLIGSVDVDGNIAQQLAFNEKLFIEKKIFGIKLYPGYQHFYPSNQKIYAIAKLCQKYNKPLVFHMGDVYDPDNTSILKYSHPIHMDDLAVKFPKCKIVISHFGFPYLLEAANVVSKNKNVFTDISGTLDEAGTKKQKTDMLSQYIKDLIRVFNYFPDVRAKTMFGTDYGGEDSPLNLVDPYIQTVEKVFSKSEQKSVFHDLAETIYFK